jgi:transposase
MLSLSSYQFWLYQHPCDMRKGFDGLSGIVRNEMNLDPLNGAVYIFFNKPRNLVKLLLWDTTGFAIYHKRLSRGSFGEFTIKTETKSTSIRRDELLCILEGIELKSIRRRKRYTLKT